jgi:O-antigen ligase
MLRGRSQNDYEPVTRSRRGRLFESEEAGAETLPAEEIWPTKADSSTRDESGKSAEAAPSPVNKRPPATFLRRGHGLTYAALFLFTVILYARPAEFYPSPLTNSIAYIVGLITLAIYAVSQITVEGTLTARPREVNLVLLFGLTGLLSIPLAITPATAWATFTDTFIRCIVIFIVMVNVVRTELRLRWLLYLVLFVSCVLSAGAVNDFRLGLLTTEGYRVSGVGKGIFGNSNDLAFHFVTIVPIAIALVFSTRGIIRKVLFGVCAAMMMAAIVVTYSRGAFLGSLASLGFLAWKLGRRHRLAVLVWGTLIVGLFLALAPGNYSIRILSIFVPGLDPVGSSSARQGELVRSIQVALYHPLFGIGMGNYMGEMSYTGLVTHNAYTQVAAEMGMIALAIYTMFVVTPLKRLGQIVRETFASRSDSRYYYLAIGLQASLIGYMVASFFLSVAYLWYVYYLVAYAVCLRRMYESDTGRLVVPETRKMKKRLMGARRATPLASGESGALTT